MKRIALAALALVALAASAIAQVIPPGTNPVPTGGAYNSSAPTCVAGSGCWFQVDINGNLKVVASGTPSGTQDVNIKQVQGAVPSLTNPLWIVPATGATFAITEPVLSTTSSTALAANLVVNATAAGLYSFTVSADSTLYASVWYIMIFNATSAPVDGAVTPLKCYEMPANTITYSAAFPNPVPFSTGIVIGVGTTGCFTKTASTHAAFISGDYK